MKIASHSSAWLVPNASWLRSASSPSSSFLAPPPRLLLQRRIWFAVNLTTTQMVYRTLPMAQLLKPCREGQCSCLKVPPCVDISVTATVSATSLLWLSLCLSPASPYVDPQGPHTRPCSSQNKTRTRFLTPKNIFPTSLTLNLGRHGNLWEPLHLTSNLGCPPVPSRGARGRGLVAAACGTTTLAHTN